MRTGTAAIALGVDPHGAPYQQRAFAVLPLLVRQAGAAQTIYYRELADEIGMPNERNLNFVLGAVGTSLVDLGQKWQEKIPPLQALVINREDGMPGPGFFPSLAHPPVDPKASKRARKQASDHMLTDVFAYPKWDEVLTALGQSPVAAAGSALQQAATYGAGGESEEHKALKTFVAANPHAIGLRAPVLETIVEYRLPSGDEIDVLFRTRRGVIAVEVKSVISPEADIVRGVFQCVKYDALLTAVDKRDGVQRDVDVVLALGASHTIETRQVANTLGIRVVERVGPSQPA